MPLIIGELDACIQLESGPEDAPEVCGARRTATDDKDKADDEAAQRLAAERLSRERRTEQRDPDRLGGR